MRRKGGISQRFLVFWFFVKTINFEVVGSKNVVVGGGGSKSGYVGEFGKVEFVGCAGEPVDNEEGLAIFGEGVSSMVIRDGPVVDVEKVVDRLGFR